jgi:elongation factor G
LPPRATWSGRKNKINILDTSGNGNFLVDTRITMDVADAAVVVVSASDGVQVYTERTWAMCDELGLPRCVLITKLDRERAEFQRALDDVRETLSTRPWPCNSPSVRKPTSWAWSTSCP